MYPFDSQGTDKTRFGRCQILLILFYSPSYPMVRIMFQLIQLHLNPIAR